MAALTVLGIAAPDQISGQLSDQACIDKKCPFHGQLAVTKELFRGKIIRKDLHHTATLEWYKPHYLPKYERYEMRRYRLRVHNPACIGAVPGDRVVAAKTRPLSKMKHHVIIQKLSKVSKDKLSKTGKTGES